MTVALGVETSSRRYGVVVLDGTEPVVELQADRAEPGFVDVGVLVADALGRAGRTSADVERLIVDVGPGNLASVRAGIAYVNALAYALDVPVVAVDSLTLLARTVREQGWGGPVLALRAGGGSSVYAGLTGADQTMTTRYGPLDEVVPTLVEGLPEIALCGAARDRATAVLAARVRVHDTGVEVPQVRALIAGEEAGTDSVSPLTERSAPFRG